MSELIRRYMIIQGHRIQVEESLNALAKYGKVTVLGFERTGNTGFGDVFVAVLIFYEGSEQGLNEQIRVYNNG